MKFLNLPLDGTFYRYRGTFETSSGNRVIGKFFITAITTSGKVKYRGNYRGI